MSICRTEIGTTADRDPTPGTLSATFSTQGGNGSPDGGVEITSVAKNGDTTKLQMWEDLVAPTLKSSLLVETWCCGPWHPPAPFCSWHEPGDGFKNCTRSVCDRQYQVEQIESLVWDGTHVEPSNYTHSKFALAKPSHGGVPWVCFGDLNRQWEQRDRGGSAACIANDEVYELLLLSVGDFEACA